MPSKKTIKRKNGSVTLSTEEWKRRQRKVRVQQAKQQRLKVRIGGR